MMKILFLISQIPYPLDTGAKIRSYNLVKELSKKHEITLVAFGEEQSKGQKVEKSKGQEDNIGVLKEYCKDVIVASRKKRNIYVAALANVFSPRPFQVDKYTSPEMVRVIHDMLKKEQYDLVHCDSVQMSRNILKVNGQTSRNVGAGSKPALIPKVLTEHNIESQIIERAARKEMNIFKKAYLYLQYIKLKRYELKVCKQFDRVITVSEEDKRFLEKKAGIDNITVVPNGVDVDYFSKEIASSSASLKLRRSPRNDGEGACGNDTNAGKIPQLTTHNSQLTTSKSVNDKVNRSLVFTGSMDWLPNEDGILYFCDEILPLIKRKEEGISLTIAGRAPSERILNLAEKGTVHAGQSPINVTGRVDDIRPYIAKGDIFIVPLRIGGGTRLKILEAMAMGKAVVSTSVGAEGLAVENGKHIIIADHPEAFTEAVFELLNDPVLRSNIEKEAKKLVRDKYDWRSIALRLDAVWTDAADACELPILLYHDICVDDTEVLPADAGKKPYILAESTFEKQMKYLHDEGYITVGLDKLSGGTGNSQKVEKSKGQKVRETEDKGDCFASLAMTGKAVAIVFDDGLVSNYKRAFPVLEKYKQKAAFFVTAGKVGEKDMMSWKQIKEMKDAGMLIGSHSMTHACPVHLKGVELEYEVVGSKNLLEEKLGERIEYFSSPTGYVNPEMIKIAKSAGYKHMLFSEPCLNRTGDGFVLSKTGIKSDYSFERFVGIVERSPLVFRELRLGHNVRKALRRILGYRGYEIVRAGMLGMKNK